MPILLDIDNINVVFSSEKCSFLGGAITSANHVQVEFFLRFGCFSYAKANVDVNALCFIYVGHCIHCSLSSRILLVTSWPTGTAWGWMSVELWMKLAEGTRSPRISSPAQLWKKTCKLFIFAPFDIYHFSLRLHIFCLENNLCFINPRNMQQNLNEDCTIMNCTNTYLFLSWSQLKMHVSIWFKNV